MLMNHSQESLRSLLLTSACVALNVGLGKIANMLGLPVSFDTVGTLLAAALLAPRYAMITGVCTNLIATLVTSPYFIAYTGTQVAIAGAAILLRKAGAFRRAWTALLAGLAVGIVSAAVSSPVTAVLFGGVAVPNVTAVNVLLLASGRSLWQSVVTGSLIVESIDKAIAGVLVWLILRRLPARIGDSRKPESPVSTP